MIGRVYLYRYGSCKLIRKQQGSLHDPDDATALIKRCQTVRFQFAVKLNQDILYHGWMISALVTDSPDKGSVVSKYMQQKPTLFFFLLQLSNLLLCLVLFSFLFFSSLFFLASASLDVHPTRPLYLGTAVMASKGKVRGELRLLYSLCFSFFKTLVMVSFKQLQKVICAVIYTILLAFLGTLLLTF